ncbi:MAG: protein tyrosine phosphatase, partial [Chloroflexi bacterium]|nr:protein tyrosine phosphatase [Chloroflexota bacterium]
MTVTKPSTTQFFVDIHCHILPGVDDGSRDREESLAMARLAEREGTREIIATPHHVPRSPRNAVDEIARRTADLQNVLDWGEVPLRVHPGQENNARESLIDQLREREAVALNGTPYVLVEPPFRTYPGFLDGLLADLPEAGLRPILAHPERNNVIQQDPTRLQALVERGTIIQINTGSLLGTYGDRVRESALALLRL